MKKIKFYSLVNGENGKPIAKLWDGWTDIYFNYYCIKHNNRVNTWHAIEPSTGLSVATGNTLKEAKQRATAPETLRKINEKITQDMIQRFFELKTEAEICL